MGIGVVVGNILAGLIVLVGAALAGLSFYNLRRLRSWKRLMRALIGIVAAGLALFYLLTLLGHNPALDPISPQCFRSMLFVMLSAGLSVEISNTPPQP